MLLVPDPARFWMDPFSEEPTLCLIGSAVDPITKEGYSFDPRTVALGMFLIVLGMHGFVLRTVARRTVTADGIAEPVEVQ